MSINVYLNSEKMEAHPSFKKVSKRDGNEEWVNRSILGMYVFGEECRHYLVFYQVEENIPEAIKDVVEKVSLLDVMPVFPKRILGRYVTKDAVAILRDGEKGNNNLHIIGKSMESVRELYYLIRRGKILPEESWEEEQVKLSPAKTFLKRIFNKA